MRKAYKCPKCHKWFLPGYMHCLVRHDDNCCHKYDIEVIKPEVAEEDINTFDEERMKSLVESIDRAHLRLEVYKYGGCL